MSVIKYEDLAGPDFSPEMLAHRLLSLSLVEATRLTLGNLETAIKIAPNKVLEHFVLAPPIQRSQFTKFMATIWVFHPSVLPAINSIAREHYVKPENILIANWGDVNTLEKSCTIESAWLIAFILSCLQPSANHDALILGSGTGYSTALLSSIVGPSGTVTCIELDQTILDQSVRNLAKSDNLPNNHSSIQGDALQCDGLEQKFDVIWPTLSLGAPPRKWARLLKDGGKMVFFRTQEKDLVRLDIITKTRGRFTTTPVMTNLINLEFETKKKKNFDIFDQYGGMEDKFSRALKDLILSSEAKG